MPFLIGVKQFFFFMAAFKANVKTEIGQTLPRLMPCRVSPSVHRFAAMQFPEVALYFDWHGFAFLRHHSGGRAAPMMEYFFPVSLSRIIMAMRCLKSATDSCAFIGCSSAVCPS
jgi:hypothetical protein